MGNKYRLVVRIVFEFKAVQVKWFGTHAEYDKINVSNIQYKKEITMELKIIKTKKQYNEYLDWLDAMFDKKIKPNTPEGNKVEVALLLIQQFEDANYAIPFPEAIEAIRIKMNDAGLKNKDLVGKFGSKGYVSALLNKRKPLTLELAKLFHHELNIPAEILLS